jgi:hypothetical protein
MNLSGYYNFLSTNINSCDEDAGEDEGGLNQVRYLYFVSGRAMIHLKGIQRNSLSDILTTVKFLR